MTPGVRPFVAGNWKMNGLSGSLAEIDAMRQAADAGESGAAELLVCPPATLIAQAAWRIKGGRSQPRRARTATPEASGAFTGDISAPMLKDAGATYVIVGHSERRTLHHETDALVRAKAEAALKAGLDPDRLRRRDARRARERAMRRRGRRPAIAGLAAAGGAPARRSWSPTSRSGRSAPGSRRRPRTSPGCTTAIRTLLGEMFGRAGAKIRLLYGGSVKPSNCARAFDPRQCRRRAGRRREPESDGISGHRRRLSLTAVPHPFAMDAPLAPC